MTTKTEHAAVLRFESMEPRDLGGMQMHARRQGGDLEGIESAFTHRNRVYEGEAFVKSLRAELRAIARRNLRAETEALRACGRPDQGARREAAGPARPWHGNSRGPLREVILSAGVRHFHAEPDAPEDQVMITYGKDDDGFPVTHRLCVRKIAEFEAAGLGFFAKHFPGAVRHLRLDLDETAPHFHALLLVTDQKTTKTKGAQTILRPAAHPMLASYEHAQDVAGEWLASLGLVRGARHAEARRKARDEERPLPKSPRHVSIREYREAQRRRREAREAEQTARDEAQAGRARQLDLRDAALRAAESQAREDREAAARTRRAAEAQARAMETGLEAMADGRIVCRPAPEGDARGVVLAGRRGLPKPELAELKGALAPAGDRLRLVGRMMLGFDERRRTIEREEARLRRGAGIVARLAGSLSRTVGADILALADGREPPVDAASFPGAWAIAPGEKPEDLSRRLDALSNGQLLNAWSATRDAATLCEERPDLARRFSQGLRVLEAGAASRGLDLDVGLHRPEAATDASRARLHLDRGAEGGPIRAASRNRQIIR